MISILHQRYNLYGFVDSSVEFCSPVLGVGSSDFKTANMAVTLVRIIKYKNATKTNVLNPHSIQ